MRRLAENLGAHLAGGATNLCRCWQVVRADGGVLGFTDHDRDIEFDGVTFKARTGLDAAAIHFSTGLAVDNSQAVGALSDLGLEEADIRAGRYDGAEVFAWLVNWRDVAARILQFRGSLGEIRRSGNHFEAELRGLSEALNVPQGRAYHKNCSAVLGDRQCGFDLNGAGYFAEETIWTTTGPGHFEFSGLTQFEAAWFERGSLRALDGPAAGLVAVIRSDAYRNGTRSIDLWEALAITPLAGDRLRLEAGCDKRAETCRLKFHNFLNFRGFPHIPGDDWALAYPNDARVNDGGSLL